MVALCPEWLVEEVLEAWRPSAWMGGDEWAEGVRELGLDESATRPGPWRSVPWQRGILDALADPHVDWVVILKAAQVGCSELVRCAIGRWAMLDPGDVLWVMADEIAAKKAMRKLHRMFKNTPALRKLLTPRKKDQTLLEMVLANGMRIVIGWAGSAQSLSSDPFRYVILDETGKYPKKVGLEASPIELAKQRTKVAGRLAKIVVLSSPAHEDDLICQAFGEVLNKRRWAVPCPSCGHVQVVDFEAYRWPGGDPLNAPVEREERLLAAARLEAEQSGWVECSSCEGAIRDVRRAMEAESAGWVSVDLDGEATTTVTEGVTERRVAFHVSEIFHWETSPSDLVAKFLRTAQVDLQGFWNGSLGLPLRGVKTEIKADLIRRRAIHPPGEIPSWATIVLATADTQGDHFWLMVRAWGVGSRSRLLDWGRVESFEELEARALEREFSVEGTDATAKPAALLIDSGGGMEEKDGSRTYQVYQWCKAHAPRALPYKGTAKDALQGRPVWRSKVEYSPKGWKDPFEVELVEANTNFQKDRLASLITAVEPVLWEESQGAEDRTYVRQLCSEHKVTETSSKGTKVFWKKRSGASQNHLWDCAYMQVVLHTLLEVEEREVTLAAEVQRGRAAAARASRRNRDEGAGWVGPIRGGRW